MRRVCRFYLPMYTYTATDWMACQPSFQIISKQFAPDRIRKTIEDFPGIIHVATYSDNLVGVAELALDRTCPVGEFMGPELNKLYIIERFSGMGIGAKLIQRSEDYLIQKGYKELWLWVWLPNERAQKFYRQHNYHAIGNAFYSMDSNTYENVVMRKQLVS